MKEVVLDNSSAVFIAKLGLFKELLKHFYFITTGEIKKEIEEGAKSGYRDAQVRLDLINDNKIRIINPKTADKIKKEFRLENKNDASVIALAHEKKALLLTEDKQIRNISETLEIKSSNTTVLIYYLHKKSIITKKRAFTLLDLLRLWGYNNDLILNIKEKILGDKNE